MNQAFWKSFMVGFLCCALSPMASARCQGRFINPVTDICWSCLFPMTLGGMKMVGGREDTPNPSGLVCECPGRLPLPVGIPVSMWEPARLVDVTRTPYCLVNMGGLQVSGNSSPQGKGAASTQGGGNVAGLKHSFYQVHWYMYPVIYWLELLVDLGCLDKSSVDLLYLSELDPFWADDETGFIINAESVLFANPIAQAACAADCVSASTGFPIDRLFWCGGCQGSLYPFSGHIPAHVGGVQGSLLATQKMMAKLHREWLLWGTSGKEAWCGKYKMPIIKKSQYKTQMTYPIPQTDGCMPLGRSDALWSSGKEFPYQGEDFGYLIWMKKNCCML